MNLFRGCALPRSGWTRRAVWFFPAAVLLGLVVAYPVLRITALSFFHFSLATEFRTEFAGLDNFIRLIFDSRFHNSLQVTLFFTLVSVALEFAAGLALALAAQDLKRGRTAVRTIFLIPWTLPTATIAVLWSWIFNDQYGIVNALLSRAGVIDAPIAWLAAPGTAMSVIIAADVWKTFPFVFLILLAGLQSVPQDLYEAMEIDGGGVWARFRYVTWPHLLPFVFVALMFRIIQAFAIFDLVYIMTGGGPGGSTETISVYAYQTNMRYMDFGYAATLVVATVILLALFAAALYAALLRRYARLF
ncbi:MAG: sugar ABC transporter permease [Acidobacteria bacterium]|nr:sugar ABC transporter permease [Acidobacteriota bacterium]